MTWTILQPKIGARGGIDAICLLTVINRIEIHLQDVGLAIALVNDGGERDFLHFAQQGSLVANHEILDKLLRDGAATLNGLATAQVIVSGLEDTRNIDA